MNKTNNPLTATRAFAALLVVFFHYAHIHIGIPFIDTFFANGNLSVSYFFVLSGFIMYLAYADNYKGYGHFIQKRIARILPLYWIALILTTLIRIYTIVHSRSLSYNLGLAFLSNATFTQVYFSKYIFAINTPGWSLCIEILFYLSFPFLLQLQKSKNRLFTFITIALYLASAIIHNLLIKQDSSFTVSAFYSPILHFNQFLIGMLAARFYQIKSIRLNLFISISCLLVIVLFMGIPSGLSAHDGLLAPVFALLIGSISVTDYAFLQIKPLVFLGEISYSVYILQLPVHDYFHKFFSRFLPNRQVEFIIYIIILIAISALFYYTLETPCRRWINNLGKKSKGNNELETQTVPAPES